MPDMSLVQHAIGNISSLTGCLKSSQGLDFSPVNFNIKTTIALDCCSIKSVLACPLVYEQMTVLHSYIFHALSIRKTELQEGNSLGIIFLAVHKLPSKIGEELRRK